MIDILSLVISLLALGFTLYQHLVYGRKIEKQQMQLNQLELEKHQKEKEDAGKAVIRLSVRTVKTGSRELRVDNYGLCAATNIRLQLKKEDEVYAITPSLDQFIDHLDSGCYRRYTLHLLEGQSCATFIVTWEDGNRKDNQLIQTVDF